MSSSGFAAALLVVCSAQPPTDPEAYASAETIEAGCSGGIAGMIRVVSVHRDGRVDYVLRGLPGARSGPDTVTKAKVDGWFAALEAARFFEHESPEREPIPDGINCGISLVGPRYSYSIDVGSAALAPEIRRVFEEVQGLLPAQ